MTIQNIIFSIYIMAEFAKTFGSKREVWNKTAKKTRGNLTRRMLMKKKGRIMSKKQHKNGKKNHHFLTDAGYITKKGEFGVFRK